MSQGAFVTLVGFVAQDPNIRKTQNDKLLTKVRVGTTPRYRDQASGEWRDSGTSYYTVTCWARLAEHVRLSLRKGDPVIVKGRFSMNYYEDKQGQPRNSVEITADTVGHDLSRGPANYMRPRAQQPRMEDDPMPDVPDDLPEGAGDMIDEEAIERFGRDLDEADLAARALNDDEDDDEAAEGAIPPVPATPF